jgi:tryptophan synthase alpha chain
MSGRPIEEAFVRCREEGRAALITYLSAGDPDLETTVALAGAVSDGGADVLELGIPFSDPLADGPIIQAAYTRALAAGSSVEGIMDLLPRIVERADLPVVLMTAFNPVMAYGVERFCGDAADAGASGLLVPDLLPEDSAPLREAAHGAGLDTIHLTAPDTTEQRLAAAAGDSSGFLYLISRRGVTGTHGGPGEGLASDVARARGHTGLPIAVGFGVSTAEDARRVAEVADGVIVGSALVRTAAEILSPAEGDAGTGREMAAPDPAAVEMAVEVLSPAEGDAGTGREMAAPDPAAVEMAVDAVRRLTTELRRGIEMAGSGTRKQRRKGNEQ